MDYDIREIEEREVGFLLGMPALELQGFRPAKDPVASSPTLVYVNGEGIKWPV